MANQEHLAILRQGVNIWNGWRQRNSDIEPDLEGAYLSGAFEQGAFEQGVFEQGANLSGANLYNYGQQQDLAAAAEIQKILVVIRSHE